MDIGMNTINGDFSLRAVALIINNNQLLVIKHDNFDCFYNINNTHHHEVVFFYLMKSTDVRIENGNCWQSGHSSKSELLR